AAQAPSAAAASSAPASAALPPEVPSLIFSPPSAPPLTERMRRDMERRDLKELRAAGGATAGAGFGLLGYAVFAEIAGPIGLAAGLIFFGGMTFYLAHRQLKGEAGPDDLKLVAPRPPDDQTPDKRRTP
ncbi:MAG: hypothetical protein KGM24_01625, partial [Elusimicrobia bacterium]|nr:hypothetical protein [Elusimicrobiota bacterium]